MTRKPIGNRLRSRARADFTSEGASFDHERSGITSPAYWSDEPAPAAAEPTWKSLVSLVLILVTAYAVWVVLAAVLQ